MSDLDKVIKQLEKINKTLSQLVEEIIKLTEAQ